MRLRAKEVNRMVCVYCDAMVEGLLCFGCGDYKGMMTIEEWESYTGEVWEYA